MIYIFRNPDNPEEVVEVVQKMNDEHVYFDESGKQWQRVFTAPQASIDTRVDPFSSKDFVKKTNKASTVGELWDRSNEMSQMRAEKNGGVDKVKEVAEKKFYAPKR